jgi:hypothetical protein
MRHETTVSLTKKIIQSTKKLTDLSQGASSNYMHSEDGVKYLLGLVYEKSFKKWISDSEYVFMNQWRITSVEEIKYDIERENTRRSIFPRIGRFNPKKKK